MENWKFNGKLKVQRIKLVMTLINSLPFIVGWKMSVKNPIILSYHSTSEAFRTSRFTQKAHKRPRREKKYNRLKVLISPTTKEEGIREKCEHKNRRNYVPMYALDKARGIGRVESFKSPKKVELRQLPLATWNENKISSLFSSPKHWMLFRWFPTGTWPDHRR